MFTRLLGNQAKLNTTFNLCRNAAFSNKASSTSAAATTLSATSFILSRKYCSQPTTMKRTFSNSCEEGRNVMKGLLEGNKREVKKLTDAEPDFF